jgi:hypothetical protein
MVEAVMLCSELSSELPWKNEFWATPEDSSENNISRHGK